jgi:hypothetical protein
MASRPRLLTMTATAQPAMACRRVMRCGHMIWGSRQPGGEQVRGRGVGRVVMPAERGHGDDGH